MGFDRAETALQQDGQNESDAATTTTPTTKIMAVHTHTQKEMSKAVLTSPYCRLLSLGMLAVSPTPMYAACMQ